MPLTVCLARTAIKGGRELIAEENSRAGAELLSAETEKTTRIELNTLQNCSLQQAFRAQVRVVIGGKISLIVKNYEAACASVIRSIVSRL